MKNNIFSTVALTTLMTCITQPVQATDFSVFADITLNESDVKDEHSNFALGGLDFFAAHQINENTFAMVELVFENDGEGFIVDLERLWIRHVFSDQLQVSAGRFHSPLGYWNRNLHHGAILQDTVSRPFFLDFEDGDAGILPVHAIGLMCNGLMFSDTEDWKYEIVLSNGPSLDSSHGFHPDEAPEINSNNVSDNNGNKSFSARVTYHPEESDWTLGLFTNVHNIGEAGDSGLVSKGETLMNQKIYGVDLQWEMDRFNLLAEVFSLQHDDKILGNGSHNSLAFYIQGGYRINDDYKVIYRFSDLSFDQDDTYYMLLDTKEQSHHVLALRYDFDGYNSLKFEYDKQVSNDMRLEDSNSFSIQWSFLIP